MANDKPDQLVEKAIQDGKGHHVDAFQKELAEISQRDKNNPEKFKKDAEALQPYDSNGDLQKYGFPSVGVAHTQEFKFDYGRTRNVTYDASGKVKEVSDSGADTPHDGLGGSSRMKVWKASPDGKGIAGYEVNEKGQLMQSTATLYNFKVLKDGTLSFSVSHDPDSPKTELHPNGDMTTTDKIGKVTRTTTDITQDQVQIIDKFDDGTTITMDGKYKLLPNQVRDGSAKEIDPDKVTIRSNGGTIEYIRGSNGDATRVTTDPQGHASTENFKNVDMQKMAEVYNRYSDFSVVWLKADKDGPHDDFITNENSGLDWARRMIREGLDHLK